MKMNRSEILEKIREDIENNVFTPEEPITEESGFVEDLGMDSLEFVEMVMGVEEVFGFDVPDEEAEKWVTVGNVVDFVEKTLKEFS